MIGKLFRSGKQSPPQRPSFQPVLESLESREVPSAAQVSAAFNQLPTDMSNLQASLAARPADPNAVATNYNAVATDMFFLRVGAAGFQTSDRLQIDNALYSNGLVLIYSGFLNHAFIPTDQFVNVVRLGGTAFETGLFDSILIGVLPAASTGSSMLT